MDKMIGGNSPLEKTKNPVRALSRETYLEANGRTSRRRVSRKWTAEGFVEHFKWVPSRQKYACLRVVKRGPLDAHTLLEDERLSFETRTSVPICIDFVCQSKFPFTGDCLWWPNTKRLDFTPNTVQVLVLSIQAECKLQFRTELHC